MEKQYVTIDKHGVYRPVGQPRMELDGIVHAFCEGASPESIRNDWPFLSLEEINGCIVFYVGHKEEVDEYLRRQEELFEKLRAEQDANPCPVVRRLKELKKIIEEARTLEADEAIILTDEGPRGRAMVAQGD